VEHGTREEFQQHLDEIELTNRHFVSYCMFKSTWDAIKETLYNTNKPICSKNHTDIGPIIEFEHSCEGV
jgi:hypothetical protein